MAKEKKEKKTRWLKSLFDEFKVFVNRGNVMDLAVGMIIGSAFTAVVSSLVKNILTPLINWIPGTGDTGALQTVLREAVTDESGQVVTPALIIDWGSVISAIVTFFLTALVLFVIVKIMNKLKEVGTTVQNDAKKVADKLVTAVKNEKEEGEPFAEATEVVAEDAAETTAGPIVSETSETESEHSKTAEELLQEILETLKAQKSL